MTQGNYYDYKTGAIASLPSGMTYNSDIARFVVNGKNFLTYEDAEWYLNYLIKFGFVTAPFTIAITGLTDGDAVIGDHVTIGYTTDPVSATETVKWSNSSNSADPATYGTGASPTDYTAGDEGQLWLHVTDTIEGETFTLSTFAPIRYAAGTAPAIADGQTFTVDTAITPIDASASGANLTWTYALSGAPAGVVINSGTGSITGTPTAASSGTVTITCTDQYGRTVTDTFTYTASLRTQATAANGLGPFSWTVDDTAVNVDATTDFTAGGNTLTYTATGLPAGVTIATNGIISGTPTAASSGSIVITGQDEYGRETTSTTSHTTALRAQATGGADLDLSFAVDEAITATDLTANWSTGGNMMTYAIIGTALPAGLSVSSAGSLTGTPTVLTADATYTLRGTDEYGRTTDDTFTLEVVESAAEFDPVSLFASGEEGAIFLPGPTTSFLSTTDLTPCGAGDTVGFQLDTSQGAEYSGGSFTGLGSELVTNGDGSSTTGWTFGGVQGFTSDGSVFSVVRNNNRTFANYPNQTILTVGKTYLISVDVIAVSDNVSISTDGENVEASTISTGTFEVVLTASSSTFYILAAGASSATATLDNISVRELPGNHATQATAASRPILRQTGGGLWYLEFDGVADCLIAPVAISTLKMSAAMAFAPTWASADRYWALIKDPVADGLMNLSADSTSENYGVGSRLPSNESISPFSLTNGQEYVSTYTKDGTASQVARVDGTQVGTNTATVTTFTSEELRLGSQLNTSFGNMNMFGFIGINRVLTTQEIFVSKNEDGSYNVRFQVYGRGKWYEGVGHPGSDKCGGLFKGTVGFERAAT